MSQPIRVSVGELEAFCRSALKAAGGDDASASAATRAMMHASQCGIDSHGVRLLEHYSKAIAGGRVNGRPDLKFVREFGATAVLDADDGHGALAAYAAMDKAIDLARTHGTGSVAIRNSSHLGASATRMPSSACTMVLRNSTVPIRLRSRHPYRVRGRGCSIFPRAPCRFSG
jgi:LDH2 family malate/lactate/ureidoglycolate dehydrogenase